MKNNLIGLTIGAAVAIIVLASVLVPVLDDETDHTVAVHNPAALGAYRLSDDEPVTIAYTDGTYSINGNTVAPLNANFTTVSSDGLIIRWSAGVPSGRYLEDGVWKVLPNGSNFSFTAEGGEGRGTVGGTEASFSYTFLYYQDAQDYTMTAGNESFYLTETDNIVCTGYNGAIGTSSTDHFFIMEGSIKEGFTLTGLDGTVCPFKSISYEKVDGFQDLYKVTMIVFDNNGTDVEITRCVVPETVTATEDYNPAVDAIIGAIPVIIIVAIIVGVVSVALRARD